MESAFGNQGYMYVMNRNTERRESLREGHAEAIRALLNDFLMEHSPKGPFRSRTSAGRRRCSPFFMRFWFLGTTGF